MKKNIILIVLIIIAFLGLGYIIWEEPLFTSTVLVKSIDRSKFTNTSNYLGKITAGNDVWLTGKIELISRDRKTIFLRTGSVLNGLPVVVNIKFDDQTIYRFSACSQKVCLFKEVNASEWWKNFLVNNKQGGLVSLTCQNSTCQKIVSISKL